jgi:hypothetical protein
MQVGWSSCQKSFSDNYVIIVLSDCFCDLVCLTASQSGWMHPYIDFLFGCMTHLNEPAKGHPASKVAVRVRKLAHPALADDLGLVHL